MEKHLEAARRLFPEWDWVRKPANDRSALYGRWKSLLFLIFFGEDLVHFVIKDDNNIWLLDETFYNQTPTAMERFKEQLQCWLLQQRLTFNTQKADGLRLLQELFPPKEEST